MRRGRGNATAWGPCRTNRALGALVVALAFPPFWADSFGATEESSAASRQEVFASQARRHFVETQAQVEKEPNNVQALCRFARACFEYADYSTSNQQREDLALRGITASKTAITNKADAAQAHYCLALNLGQLARTKRLSALKIVQEMERSFLRAIALDASIDHAGPHRALGVLYQDAPGWPVSIGSRKNARTHFDKAIQLHPDYPGSRLCLLEGLLAWNERQAASQRLQITQQVLTTARSKLTGPQWEPTWDEWDRRWGAITNQLAGYKLRR